MMDERRLKIDLVRDEGRVDKIYSCSLGHKTFGIGHLILETDEEYGLPEGTPVSDDRINYCFEKDLDSAIIDAVVLYGEETWWNLPGDIQEILVNMTFNLGRTRLSKFKKMNKAIAEGDWKEAAKEGRDSRWYDQVGNRAERLMTRMENFGD
jgi:lysozyme